MRGDGKEEGREGSLGGQSRPYTVREKKGGRRSGVPPAGRLGGQPEEQGTIADDLQLSYRGLAASKFFAAHKAGAPLSVVAFPLPPCPSAFQPFRSAGGDWMIDLCRTRPRPPQT